MDKVVATALEAVADVPDGASLAVGGFGLSGVPNVLIEALYERSVSGLSVVSNGFRRGGGGPPPLPLVKGGEIKVPPRQYLAGELELELIPQGTLAERLRAGGAGIPAFYTPAGVGTQVAEGGLPWRYDGSGGVALASPPKEVREFDGTEYVLERAIRTDFALVRAAKGDRHGNLVFNKSTRNFNPLAAMAGRITVAEVEELVEPGEIDPDAVHLPGIFVQRVIALTPEQAADKRIEQRTVSS
ncbi:succinyl-CoA:3-ketoacid-CoA transferase [Streptomyces sp. NRRL WC-3618]|uniref:CoA transferase subunit A n=1 Tax=Streptomyces sp. NRRL WC-3618 TaxID=1519490 RepID=UPI0006AFCE44|nr:CoA transferase subunit A [Streptomyces sp. NRRL WC-3618]KOV57593.1 succinyl-CoA:3-ketoacid-CoA transferase [Streptomyces sp. NRRL WC-3618]